MYGIRIERTGQIWQFRIPERWTDKISNAISNQLIGRCIEQDVKTGKYAKRHIKISGKCCDIGYERSSYIWLIVQIEFAITGANAEEKSKINLKYSFELVMFTSTYTAITAPIRLNTTAAL